SKIICYERAYAHTGRANSYQSPRDFIFLLQEKITEHGKDACQHQRKNKICSHNIFFALWIRGALGVP
ncbi:MAG: hypothetical protein PUH03_02165, partial [bacterium]|nr:hypothetical protein [bacterium]